MSRREGRRTRWLAVLLLLVLAPVCAEYIQAYDDSTGNPVALLGALLVFVPLYGAPAVLIRELARRFDVRWPGILALTTGFGILQAGVIDQSMFDTGYRGIDYWDDMILPTWIEPLGISVNASLAFVLGHAIWSFGVPIALSQAVSGRYSRTPWLRWPGLSVLVALYLAAAALIMVGEDSGGASSGQVVGALAVTAALALFAFTLGRRRRDRHDRKVPAPLLVFAVAAPVSFGFNMLGYSVTDTVIVIGVLVVTAAAVTYLSGSHAWTGRHVAALASGTLLGRVGIGFLTDPLGDVSAMAHAGHSVFFLLMALGLWLWADRRSRATLAADGLTA